MLDPTLYDNQIIFPLNLMFVNNLHSHKVHGSFVKSQCMYINFYIHYTLLRLKKIKFNKYSTKKEKFKIKK